MSIWSSSFKTYGLKKIAIAKSKKNATTLLEKSCFTPCLWFENIIFFFSCFQTAIFFFKRTLELRDISSSFIIVLMDGAYVTWTQNWFYSPGISWMTVMGH
jgi:hypothetical protein